MSKPAKCRECGQDFEADHDSDILCPECEAELAEAEEQENED